MWTMITLKSLQQALLYWDFDLERKRIIQVVTKLGGTKAEMLVTRTTNKAKKTILCNV